MGKTSLHNSTTSSSIIIVDPSSSYSTTDSTLNGGSSTLMIISSSTTIGFPVQVVYVTFAVYEVVSVGNTSKSGSVDITSPFKSSHSNSIILSPTGVNLHASS